MQYVKQLVVGSLLGLLLVSCGSEAPITPFRGQVKFETLAITGKVSGRIREIRVSEGQRVAQGDTLAVLDLPEVSARLQQADGAVTAARGQFDLAREGATSEQREQIEGQLSAARAQQDFARESHQRLLRLFGDSLITRQQLDEVAMKLEMARGQVASLEARLQEVNKGSRREQISQVQGMLDRALGAREEVLVTSGERYLLAPRAMSIETISLHEGELLTAGYTLINGYELGSLYFRFTVPESRVYQFRQGEQLQLQNPYTGEEISAGIVAIRQLPRYADITTTSPVYALGESMYELKLQPTAPADYDRYHLNATLLLKDEPR